MISRLIHRELKTVTAAAVIIASLTLLSKIVGLIRDRVFAHYFGVGPVMDAYYAAFKIPDLIYNLLIVGALTAGFIPTFSKLFFESEDKTRAWKLANNVVTIIGMTLIILALVGVIFTSPLTALVAPGFSGESRHLATQFTRIMFFSPLFLGISMVLGGILQSLKQFIIYSLAPIAYNLGIILGATLLTKTTLGNLGLAWGVVLGSILHAGIQAYGAYHNGYRFKFAFNLKDADTRLIGKLMIPRTIGLAVTQFNLVIVTILASLLPVGSVAIFNYANNLQAVPLSLIGIPFAIAVFPVLSEMVAKQDAPGFVQHLSSTIRTIIFLMMPAAVLMLLLRAQLVRVILGTGQFDWIATKATANTVAFFALGLLGAALVPTLARAFYALSNTKTPFTLGIIAELLSIIASLLLMRPLGVAGLALASSVGVTINAVFLLVALWQNTKDLELNKLLSTILKVSAATLAMGLVVQYLKYPLANIFDQRFFWGIFGQGFFAGLFGVIVYALAAYWIKIPEMVLVISAIKRRWLGYRQMPPGLDEAEKL